jgi:L,D-transpeptidase catalytic domain
LRPRLAALLLGASLAALLCSPSAALAGSGHVRVAAPQQLAVLLSAHRAHLRPRAGARVLVSVPELRPITGERTTLPVIGYARGPDGIPWLRVLLPGRPNGASGWIAAQGTRKSMTGWHLIVSLGERRVRVYRAGRLLRTFGAVVGKPSTPTPTGRFFVEETLQMSLGEPGGPFALALSARSDALQEFEGGPGQIALHGRDNLGGVLGEAESHGCVRLATASIDWLAQRIGPGVPVTIDAH